MIIDSRERHTAVKPHDAQARVLWVAGASGPSLLLRGVCGTPKRAWVDTIGIEFEHRVVELACSRRRLVQGNEIPDVLPRLADDAGIIVVFRYFVPGDHCQRIQRLEPVERGNPFKPAP